MVDHVRTLLLNPTGVSGYRHVTDAPADEAMALFGVSQEGTEADAAVVDRLLPLALAPDLVEFRRGLDSRTTPRVCGSLYRQTEETLSPSGLYERVLGTEGHWTVASLFQHEDTVLQTTLSTLRSAASGKDAPFALGAVLLACALRRNHLQET